MTRTRTNNNAIAFLRVSSQNQRDNASHEIQLSEIKQYATRNGLELTRIAKLIASAKDSDQRKQYHEQKKWALANDVMHFVFYIVNLK